MSEDDRDIGAAPDPWSNSVPDLHRGGDAFGTFLRAFRDLQNAVSESDPPARMWADLAGEARAWTDRLSAYAVPERDQPAGTRRDLPGRGHPFLLGFVEESSNDETVSGTVSFERFHLGGNGSAHGGAIPLLFDEVLGHLANAGERPRARTASLTVHYRRITPIGVPLRVEAVVERQDGRKRWLSGRLLDGDALLASAEGLFVELRPGQP
jgi:acyl-coenzyme A thioesterase PaaI-like protein